MYCFGVYMT